MLRGCFPPGLRRALEELPKSLDTTYERILLGIERGKREYACRLLQCIAVSFRPLRVEELGEVLAIRPDSREEYHSDWRPEDAHQAVFSACSSLITVANVDGSPVVQFSHFSVKEFLVSSRLSNATEHLSCYHILPDRAHMVLAHSCLSILLNLGDQVDRSIVEKRPFAMYAARYWVDHSKVDDVLPSIHDLLGCLFDPDGPYFATWVWIYDIDRPWKGSMATVRPTQSEAKPLYYAALCGFHNLIEYLTTTHKADVNARGGDHGTALNAAFAKGKVEIARTLIRHGADINILDGAGQSSLYRAIFGGHHAAVKLLLEHQADVNIQTGNKFRMTPLHVAAQAGELDICRKLLKHGADVETRSNYGWLALHYASQHGSLDVVQLLLDHGANVNVQEEEQLWSPLHFASYNGDLKIAELIIKHDAEVDVQNENKETPLFCASGYGRLEVARMLVECGAHVNSQNKQGWTPSHSAAWNGHLSLVELLLDSGADVGMKNSSDKTPLDLAEENGKHDVASFLARRSGIVYVLPTISSTPLEAVLQDSLPSPGIMEQQPDGGDSSDDEESDSMHDALESGRLGKIRRLLDRGGDVNERNELLQTPLEVASMQGKLEIARILIKYSADVNSREIDGWTPLHSAASFGHIDVVQLLLDNGADIHATQREGFSALHIASGSGHIEIVQLLLEQGANAQIRDVHGMTPSQYALRLGFRDIARFLSAYDDSGV